MSENVHLSAEISRDKLHLLEQTRQKHQLDDINDTLDFIFNQYSALASLLDNQAMQQQLAQDATNALAQQIEQTTESLEQTLAHTSTRATAAMMVETVIITFLTYTKHANTEHAKQASEQTRYDTLKEAYKQALEEWETSGDAELWDSASADGLTPEREYNPTK